MGHGIRHPIRVAHIGWVYSPLTGLGLRPMTVHRRRLQEPSHDRQGVVDVTQNEALSLIGTVRKEVSSGLMR